MATPTKVKNIVVSGGAQGIGRCITRTLLRSGHRVFILDINEAELKHTTTEHLSAHAPNISSSICNLRSVRDIRRSVAEAAEFFGGRIDCLVNNGGIAHPYWKDGESMDSEDTIEQWQAYIETNLTAPFAVSQACIPYMRMTEKELERVEHAGPVIIHVGSFRAKQSDPNQEGYASTKAGLLGLTQSMAITCQQWGIRVNLIAPGRIKVEHECREGDEKGLRWDISEDDIEPHPANRPGKPEDIAEAVQYLMGAGFINGHDLVIDGGALKMKNDS